MPSSPSECIACWDILRYSSGEGKSKRITVRKGDGVEALVRWANWDSRNVLGVPVWKSMWGRYIPRRKLAMTVFA